MHMNRLAATVIFLGICAVSLSACGKRGALVRPEGGTYPRFYPGGIPAGEWDESSTIVVTEEEREKKKTFLDRTQEPMAKSVREVGELE